MRVGKAIVRTCLWVSANSFLRSFFSLAVSLGLPFNCRILECYLQWKKFLQKLNNLQSKHILPFSCKTHFYLQLLLTFHGLTVIWGYNLVDTWHIHNPHHNLKTKQTNLCRNLFNARNWKRFVISSLDVETCNIHFQKIYFLRLLF